MDLESGKVTLAQVAMLPPAASRFPLSTSSREPFPCSRFVGRLACVARLSNGAWKNFLGKRRRRRRRHIFLRCSICRSTSTFSAFEHQQTTPPARRGRPSSGASSAKANHVYYNELRSETHRSMPNPLLSLGSNVFLTRACGIRIRLVGLYNVVAAAVSVPSSEQLR